MPSPDEVKKLIEEAGGTIDVDGTIIIPENDGSAHVAMMASFPLRPDHWLLKDPEKFNVPPMPFRRGTDNPTRKDWEKKIRAAARYALRCSTMNGKDDDLDPDALVQNMVVGMLGYNTPDGYSDDEWANPPRDGKD